MNQTLKYILAVFLYLVGSIGLFISGGMFFASFNKGYMLLFTGLSVFSLLMGRLVDK